jgi:hypothetical protein
MAHVLSVGVVLTGVLDVEFPGVVLSTIIAGKADNCGT